MATEKKLLESRVVNFFSGKKEYRSLSNFWENDVQIGSRVYESGEHCFHGEKYFRLGELCLDENRRTKLIEYGKRFLKPSMFMTPVIAKRMGGKKGLCLTFEELDIWNTVSIEVQKDICAFKYKNYEEVRDDLMKSGDKILIHPAMRCSEEKLAHRIWEGKAVIRNGGVEVLGKNMLGNLWVEYR